MCLDLPCARAISGSNALPAVTAAALAAVKLGIPIAHVEGGIRLAIKNPEEINRRLVDHVSSLIFCPTRRAVQSLAEENIRNGVHFVGDTMLDATRMVAELFKSHPHDFHDMSSAYAPYILMTIHRAENTNDKRHFENILTYVQKEAGGQNIVFPAHPRTVQFCCNNNISLDPFRVIKPIGYFDMYSLLRGASAVFTDSGGLQKEAFFHRVPCTLIYDESPWPETIAAGWNRLWTSVEYLPRKDCDEFGDGRASSRIAHILYSYLANNSREVD